jgi:drug/metabolite transporter (DMT)-like permease
MLIASGISTFSGVFAKIVTTEISSLETVFFRNIIGLIIISISLLYKPPAKLKKGKGLLLFSRGFLGFVGILLYFYSIQNISLGLAVTLNKTSPLFGALFSFIFLHEKLRKNQILAMFVAFIGVVIIFIPSRLYFDIGMIFGFLSGFVAGLAYTSIRKLKGFYNTREILFSFTFAGSLFPIILLTVSNYIDIPNGFEFMLSPFIKPSFYTIIFIIGLGLSGTIAQYFMTKAYENIKTGIAGTIGYSSVPFSIFLGVLLGDEVPSLLIFCGISFIICGGILLKGKSKSI